MSLNGDAAARILMVKRVQAYLGICAALATAILWGSNHVVSRAMREIIPLPSFVFWRWFLALLILTFIFRNELLKNRDFISKNAKGLAISGALGVGLFSYLLIGGAYTSPAVEVGLLNATTPIWIALIGILLGIQKTRSLTWLGLLVSLCGTALVVTRGDLETAKNLTFGLGNILTLSAAIVFAWFSIKIRIYSRECGALVLTIVTAWAGIIIVLLPAYVISLAYGLPLIVNEGFSLSGALAGLLYAALFPTMLGNVFFLFGVKSIGPSNTSVFLYLSPVFSALFALEFLNEPLQWFHIAGFCVVVLGLVLIGLANRKIPDLT
jgi:drug/metabolite transporter (DMT)-like permease